MERRKSTKRTPNRHTVIKEEDQEENDLPVLPPILNMVIENAILEEEEEHQLAVFSTLNMNDALQTEDSEILFARWRGTLNFRVPFAFQDEREDQTQETKLEWAKSYKYKNHIVFNTGAPVRAMEFLPANRHTPTPLLAVLTFNINITSSVRELIDESGNPLDVVSHEGPSLVQIWRFGESEHAPPVFCLGIEFADAATGLQWHPKGFDHDGSRLGILGVISERQIVMFDLHRDILKYENQFVRFCDLQSSYTLALPSSIPDPLTAFSFSTSDPYIVAVGTQQSRLCIFNLSKSEATGQYAPSSCRTCGHAPVEQVGLSHTDDLVFVFDQWPTMWIFHLSDLSMPFRKLSLNAKGMAGAFFWSPEATVLLGGADGGAFYYDMTGAMRTVISLPDNSKVTCLDITPNFTLACSSGASVVLGRIQVLYPSNPKASSVRKFAEHLEEYKSSWNKCVIFHESTSVLHNQPQAQTADSQDVTDLISPNSKKKKSHKVDSAIKIGPSIVPAPKISAQTHVRFVPVNRDKKESENVKIAIGATSGLIRIEIAKFANRYTLKSHKKQGSGGSAKKKKAKFEQEEV